MRLTERQIYVLARSIVRNILCAHIFSGRSAFGYSVSAAGYSVSAVRLAVLGAECSVFSGRAFGCVHNVRTLASTIKRARIRYDSLHKLDLVYLVVCMLQKCFNS